MFSGARLYDSRTVTRTGAGPSFFLSLSFLLSYPSSYSAPATLSPTSMAILRRFLRCQVPLLLRRIVRVYAGFYRAFKTGLVVRLFASRSSCGREAIRVDISAECGARSTYKGRLRRIYDVSCTSYLLAN